MRWEVSRDGGRRGEGPRTEGEKVGRGDMI